MSESSKKTKPKHCGKTMNTLYIRKGTDKRKWIAVGYFCEKCNEMVKEEDSAQIKRVQEIQSEPNRLVKRISRPKGIVIDIGESFTKVGVVGESTPRLICDTAIYFDKTGEAFIQEFNFIEKIRELETKTAIVSRGSKDELKVNIDHFEIFMNLIFSELDLDPSKTDILLIEKPHFTNSADSFKGREDLIKNSSLPVKVKEFLLKAKMVETKDGLVIPQMIRRQMAQVLFDRLNVPRIYFSVGEILALYSTGGTTGVIVSVGSKTTRIVPIYEGFIISHAISIRQKGGMNVVDKVGDYIEKQGIKIDGSPFKREYILKNTRISSEELCYISQDIGTEEKLWQQSDRHTRSLNVVNDSFVKLDSIRYLAPEILFEKEKLSVSMKEGDLVDAVIESVEKCDMDLFKFLIDNIILVGGGTMYEGFVERFTQDIKNRLSEKHVVNISAPEERFISTWIGGSILSTLKIFKENNLWVTRAEYDEQGSKAVDRCI
ncbi:MAG: actin family protein [Candidatus Heimdallarchaeota archaeon]|nr:actin family protein [Candidatus Heimdallarchaeota archaeon]MCK4770236.1 actin family protein [Candidatus Heimdallarchaeota archaeon]